MTAPRRQFTSARAALHGETPQHPAYDALHWQYESRKKKWLADNPDASPAEIEAALHRICRDLGI